MNTCETCAEMGCKDCMNCELGNPCIGCTDYNKETHTCSSNGGCGR